MPEQRSVRPQWWKTARMPRLVESPGAAAGATAFSSRTLRIHSTSSAKVNRPSITATMLKPCDIAGSPKSQRGWPLAGSAPTEAASRPSTVIAAAFSRDELGMAMMVTNPHSPTSSRSSGPNCSSSGCTAGSTASSTSTPNTEPTAEAVAAQAMAVRA